MPSQSDRFRPAFKAIAGLTVFAFILTSLLPAGWAMPSRRNDTLRGMQGEESPQLQAGLEEALGGPEETDEAELTRRDFLKTTAGLLMGPTFVGLLDQMAQAQTQGTQTAKDPSRQATLFLLQQQGAVSFARLKRQNNGQFVRETVFRSRWARGLPVTYFFDPEGSRLLREVILAEARAEGKTEAQVSGRYFRGILSQQTRSFSYTTAVAVLGFVAAAQSERSVKRKKQLLARAKQAIEAWARLEQGSGKIGYSYVVAESREHDRSVQTGTLAWVGEAILDYQRASRDKQFQKMATRFGDTLLSYQRKGVRDSKRAYADTGLIPMGHRGGKEVPWGSTEYNVDAYFFLRDLGAVTGEAKYTRAAEQVARGIEKHLYDAIRKRFNRGLNDIEQVLDANSWGALFLLARGKPKDAKAVRDYIDKIFRREVPVEGKKPLVGFAPHSKDSFIWSEGSFGVVLLDRRLGNETAAATIETSLHRLQIGNGGFRYAYPPAWTKGSDPALYTAYPDAASTGWSLIGRSRTFWAPKVPEAGLEEAPFTVRTTDTGIQVTPAPLPNFWETRGALSAGPVAQATSSVPEPAATKLAVVSQIAARPIEPPGVEPKQISSVTPVQLPSAEEVWTPQGRNPYRKKPFDRLNRLLKRAVATDSLSSLQSFAVALSLEGPSNDLEPLRAQVIDALAQRYRFNDRDLVQWVPGKGVEERAQDQKARRIKNKLRRAAGLTTLEVERAWKEQRYLLYRAVQGNRTVKAVIVARAQKEGLMGVSFEAIGRLNQLREAGTDVTVLALGPHAPEAFALQYAEAVVEQNLKYLRRVLPPEEVSHKTGYVTFVTPTEQFDALQVEHTTDPLVAWVRNRHGQQAAVDVALSLEPKGHLRQARFGTVKPAAPLSGLGSFYLADAQVREGIFERRGIDLRVAKEKEQAEQGQVGLLAAAAIGVVAGSAIVGTAATADAQQPAATDLPQLQSSGTSVGQPPVVIRVFDPSLEVDAAVGELPVRVQPQLPFQARTEGPGVVSTINVVAPQGEKDPLKIAAKQTTTPRVMTTPANFSRDPKGTAVGRLTDGLAGIRSWARKLVYGEEDPNTWTATQEPTNAMLLPGHRVGYTVWNPERLGQLGDDRVQALFASIGRGATEGRTDKQKTKPVLLYETNWPVTLRGAQNEESPVASSVLAKVQSHIQMAHRNGIQVAPLYSGTSALGDPAAAVQHLNIALQQGFDPGIIVTDIEPWAVPASDPEGWWQRARLELDQAVARGDAKAVSRARQKLLNIAMAWQRVHEEILRRVVPEDRAYPETLEGPPQLYAFVNPAFVPYLRLAMIWDQVRQQAEAKGLVVRDIWTIFDSVTQPEVGKDWTEADLLNALKAGGLDLKPEDLRVTLLPRQKLIVMAYSYVDGQEAESVAAQMELAYAGGFGGQMGLAVNLEPEHPVLSLANRSERAGQIVAQITQRLSQEKETTGFDGQTVFVHLADELGLVDMTKDGKLTWPRQLTPERLKGPVQFFNAAVRRAFGVPERMLEEQHRVPSKESIREFSRRQAVSGFWGLGGGVIGIGPWYAFDRNLHNWIANDLVTIHPDTGPLGPELGGGERGAGLLMGVLAGGQVKVVDMHLHLVKRGEEGQIVRELTVRHIPGRNSPIISDDVWDEAQLEVTVRRTGTALLDWKLMVDMAAKVENRDVATSATPREEWTNAILNPFDQEKTFTVKLPKLMSGSNNITLLTHDNQGRIMQWIGPGQNALYLAPFAPLVADQALERLNEALQDLKDLKVRLGKKPEDRLTAQELAQAGRYDLIVDQQALALNPLSVRAGARAEVILQTELPKDLDVNQTDQALEALKLDGVTVVAVQVPDLIKEARKALGTSDVGLGPFAGGQLRGPQYTRLVQFVQVAHRHGIKVHLVLGADELFQAAKELESEVGLLAGTQRPKRSQQDLVGDLVRLILLAKEQSHWNTDSIAFHQPRPDEDQRQLIERIVREGLGVSVVVIGPQGRSSERSLYAQTVPLADDPQAVLRAVDRILDQPQPKPPKGERFSRAIVLQGKSLADAVTWFGKLPTVDNSPAAQASLWPVDPSRLVNPEAQPAAGMTALLDRVRVPDVRTLQRFAAPSVIDEMFRVDDDGNRKPFKVTQKEFLEALHWKDPSQEPEPWAEALVKARAYELQMISEVSQIERYGSPFDNVMLSLFGIQLSPLIMTEAQRAEVVPLVPGHLYQQGGSAWLGVQVTNPTDPDLVKSPAVYDVSVQIDYPAWTGRPTSVHKTLTMVLKPGETAPAWIQLDGLPQEEDSRVVRVRVIPRGSEENRPGQIGTRSDEEQVLELAGSVIHGKRGDRKATQDLNDDFSAFSRWWNNWAKVHGIPQGDSQYNQLFEEKLNLYFGVGTPGQRANILFKRDPATGNLAGVELTPRPMDVRGFAQDEANKVRQALENWKTEQLARVQEQPPSFGRSALSFFYTAIAFVGTAGVAAAYLLGMLKGYRRSRQALQYYRRLRQEAVQLTLGRGPILHPAGQLTQTFSMTQEEVIRIGSPGETGIPSRPAMLQPGQRQPAEAMAAYGKNPVIVLDDPTQALSENIERTLVDPLATSRPGRPAPSAEALAQARRSLFQRAAPRLLGLTLLSGVAAFLLGAPVVGIAIGAAVATAAWVALALSTRLQGVAGALLTLPMRVAGSSALNHPITVALFGVATLVGAVMLALALQVPLTAVAIVAAVWAGLALLFAIPGPGRSLAALGVTALGTVVLLGLLALTLPIWWWFSLSVATLLITQRILMNFLEAELPMEGLVRGIWGAMHFVVKWGLFAAVVYWVGWVLHPWLWSGAALKLPFVSQSILQWGGLGSLLSKPIVALTLPLVGKLSLTGGLIGVGLGLLVNLVNQVRMVVNRLRHVAADQRDWWSLGIGGFGPVLLTAVAFWLWSPPVAAAAITYIGAVAVLMTVGSGGLSLTVSFSDWVKSIFERRDKVDRASPDQRVLPAYDADAEDHDGKLYTRARQAAAGDSTLQKRQGVRLGAPRAGETLNRDQQRLVNWHYWRLLAIQQAQAQEHFEGLSRLDQRRLINMYFTELLKAHADTVIGEDAGTAIRTLGPGLWTGRLSEVVRQMRNEDRLAVVMPALILSLAWGWGRGGNAEKQRKEAFSDIRAHPWRVGWELFRMFLVSFAVPLGFLASMLNRTFGAMFFKGGNMGNTLRQRGDAGLSGYTDPIGYVILVMGRWIVGHVHILMRTYLGRMITRNAADRLLTHRWQRKNGSVHERIEHLRGEADAAWDSDRPDAYRRLMGAALYAALTGEKNLFFDVGETETPEELEEMEWNADPDEDGLDDDTFYGPEWNRGKLAGVVAQRYYGEDFRGVHVYFPTKVVWNEKSGDWGLSKNPGKFRIGYEFGGHPKSRLADGALKYFQGRVTPVPEFEVVTAGMEEAQPAPEPEGTHRLRIRFVSEEDGVVSEIQQARQTVQNPRNRYQGSRRIDGAEAARQMAVRRHQVLLGDTLGGDIDRRQVLRGELGHDAYRNQRGAWYQLRLNIFGWLHRRFQGFNSRGERSFWRGLGWWALVLGAGAAVGLSTGSLMLGLFAVVVPWLIGHFYGTLVTLSFIGLGIQDTILQGAKGHYQDEFLLREMGRFFEGRTLPPVSLDQDYDQLLQVGWQVVSRLDPGDENSGRDAALIALVANYPRAIHPHGIGNAGLADPALVELVRRFIPDAPGRRAPLARAMRERIETMVEEKIASHAKALDGDPALLRRAVLEALTRNTQMELAAIGNDVAGIQYHRSRSPDVFRAGDENDQFATDGNIPLVQMMGGLGVPPVRDRSWARASQGTFYGGVRMPSLMYTPTADVQIEVVLNRGRAEGFIVERVWRDASGDLQVVVRYDGVEGASDGYLRSASEHLELPGSQIRLVRSDQLHTVGVPAAAVRRITPMEAYLEYGQGQTVNQFTLATTHLQPDLEAVEEFMREESQRMAESMPATLTVGQVNAYLAEKEQRLGLPEETFVRLRPSDQRWLNANLSRLRQQLQSEGQVRMSPAQTFPRVARILDGVRTVLALAGAIGGFFFPVLWAVTAVLWIVGLAPVRSGLVGMIRWIQPQFIVAAIQGRSLDPYSNDVTLLNLLYGARPDQVIRSATGGFGGLRWSSLDGLHDSSRWRLSVGSYLFPGTPIGRMTLWERGATKLHATPVPFVAAVMVLEQPPWLAPASGIAGRVPTDAFELGESFAEDTLFGWVNLHHQDEMLRQRPPTLNAFNIHKADYLFGQQELRKRDEATTRAIQLFKGMAIDYGIDHLFDHPLMQPAQETHLQAILRGSLGMEAFRRDEVAAAGARGAGTLSYGYTGFTASNLYSRRVGPYAPGDVRAYWEYRYYRELDSLFRDWNGNSIFFRTMREIQREHQEDLPPDSVLGSDDTRNVLLRGLLVDPFVALAQAGVRMDEDLRRNRYVTRQIATSQFDPLLDSTLDPSLFGTFVAITEDVRLAEPEQELDRPLDLEEDQEGAGLEELKPGSEMEWVGISGFPIGRLVPVLNEAGEVVGRAVFPDPAQVQIRSAWNPEMNLSSFPRWQQPPGPFDERETARLNQSGQRFGTWLDQMDSLEETQAGPLVFLSNSLQPDFHDPWGFLIVDGRLIRQRYAMEQYPYDTDRFRSEEGYDDALWAFVLEPGPPRVTALRFEQNQLTEDAVAITIEEGRPVVVQAEPAGVTHAISGIPLLLHGEDVSDQIRNNRVPTQRELRPNEVVWSLEREGAFSALGATQNGDLILLAVTEHVQIGKIAKLLQELGATDAIMMGGSADVNQWVGNGQPTLAGEADPGSTQVEAETGKAGQRPLNSVLIGREIQAAGLEEPSLFQIPTETVTASAVLSEPVSRFSVSVPLALERKAGSETAPAASIISVAQAQRTLARLAAKWGISDLADEVRIAVVSPQAVENYPQLTGLVGQSIPIGAGWLMVVPEDPDQMADLVTPFVTQSVTVQEYGAIGDPVLDIFRNVMQFAGFAINQIDDRKPVEGLAFLEILRKIVANLAGIEEGAISAEDLLTLERVLEVLA